jgi:hypothetical protein
MKRSPIILLITSFFLFVLAESCGPSQSDYDALKKENAKLEKQLDSCRHGADKLHSRIEQAFEEEDYATVTAVYSELERRHPDYAQLDDAEKLKEKAKQIQEEKIRQAELKREKEKQEKLKALNKLRKSHDDVEGITWYKNSYFVHYNETNRTSIYIGDNGSHEWLRLKMSYSGDDWIFFEEAYLSYEGNTKQIYFDDYDDKETDNGSIGVWEWIDVSVSSGLEDYLREFSQSSQAKMRLSGKYTETRNLTWEERQGIRDVLNGYDALKKYK